MEDSEFQRCIRSGLGRPFLHEHRSALQRYRDVILDACLHCYAVDPQFEGTRAGYMLDLVDLTPDREFYCSEVLKALATGGDSWDTVQRFQFAAHMALDGDAHAKKAIYDSFDPGPRMGESIAISFVLMDGLKGLLFAADKIGALLAVRPDEVDQGWLWFRAVEICSEQEVKDALLEAGRTNANVEAYRIAAEADSNKRSNTWKDIRELDYEQLKLRMLSGTSSWPLRRWGEQASPENLRQAAHGLLDTRDLRERIDHLRIFAATAFPLDPSILIEFAESTDDQLGSAAARALTNIAHPAARTLAFRLTESALAPREHAIAILTQNWQAGDHETALCWFQAEPSPDVRHRLGMDLRRMWERHSISASEVDMLRSIYEFGPCSYCREFVVARLIALEALTADMRLECAHDASDEVQQLVA